MPSHFVLLYKSGMPLCRLVQAAGRAMGEQARQLRANGFNDVLLLTQAQDYDVICAYPEFLKAIKPHLHHILGVKLMDIVLESHSRNAAHIRKSVRDAASAPLLLDSDADKHSTLYSIRVAY